MQPMPRHLEPICCQRQLARDSRYPTTRWLLPRQQLPLATLPRRPAAVAATTTTAAEVAAPTQHPARITTRRQMAAIPEELEEQELEEPEEEEAEWVAIRSRLHPPQQRPAAKKVGIIAHPPATYSSILVFNCCTQPATLQPIPHPTHRRPARHQIHPSRIMDGALKSSTNKSDRLVVPNWIRQKAQPYTHTHGVCKQDAQANYQLTTNSHIPSAGVFHLAGWLTGWQE